MTEFIYVLLVIATYFVIKAIYLEEHNKKQSTPIEKLILLILAFGTFPIIFLMMAWYTIKYPPHDGEP